MWLASRATFHSLARPTPNIILDSCLNFPNHSSRCFHLQVQSRCVTSSLKQQQACQRQLSHLDLFQQRTLLPKPHGISSRPIATTARFQADDETTPQPSARQTSPTAYNSTETTSNSSNITATSSPPPTPPTSLSTPGPLPFSTTTLLNHLSTLTHRLNTLTGTDYTPITSLRSRIASQETHLSSLFTALAAAKSAHASALNKRTASQKEVVQLLERKHSWSAADLERYMALIRSEHVDDGAVVGAAEALAAAERDLEEGRQVLERFERELYHEEQVWSDTIRRNSTWVTVGLMGLNVGLLVVSLVAVEPWRRRRLVREIRGALDEKVAGPLEVGMAEEKDGVGEALVSVAKGAALGEGMDKGVDEVVARETDSHAAGATSASGQEGMTWADEGAPQIMQGGLLNPELESKPSNWGMLKVYWVDLFSERRIAIRKKDLTAAAVEGAAAGAALMGLLFVLLRPR